MNKIVISIAVTTLLLGFSQAGQTKEHKGPKADRGSSYNSHSARDRGNNRSFNRRADTNRNDRGQHRYRDNDRNSRHHSSRDRYRDHDRSRARYRDHYRPRYSRGHYKHYRPRHYPTDVYYLGQDWYYYGGYYHPFPRYHVHTRFCHHRYWEPLAVGIILGSVLGW